LLLVPLAAFFEKIDSLEAFEDATLGANGGGGLKATMLRHRKEMGLERGE